MTLHLPGAVAAYYRAEKADDFAALAACFSESGRVADEDRVHEGRTAIAAWMADAKRKYRHKTEPLSCVERAGAVVVAARISGEFPGSPIELEQRFELAGDKIAALEIG